MTIRRLRPSTYSKPCITIENWQAFLTSVYPAPPPTSHYLTLYGVLDPILDRRISLEELGKSLRKLKNGKAPGTDLVPNECLKYLTLNWRQYLLELFNKTLDTEATPEAWSNSVLTMIYKKGDRTDPGNYRGIALINCISKLFTMIIRERLYMTGLRNAH